MKIEYQDFEVQVPTVDGSGVAEKLKVKVPVYWDEEIKDWIMTPEAHEIIDNTKARLVGLLLPAQLKALRDRFDYSQKEMGELFQVGEKSWTRWETGNQRPSRSLNLLIRALYDGEISLNYLLKRAGKAPRPIAQSFQTQLGHWHRALLAMNWFLAAEQTVSNVEVEWASQPKAFGPDKLQVKTTWGALRHATPVRQPAWGKRHRRFDYHKVKLA